MDFFPRDDAYQKKKKNEKQNHKNHKTLERGSYSRWEWIDLAKIYSQDTAFKVSETFQVSLQNREIKTLFCEC